MASCVRDVSVHKLNHKWAQVSVPKAGRVRLRLSRPLPDGKLVMARITRDRKGRWHVAFPAPQPAVEREPTGAVVGIDRGVATTLATADGRMLRAPVMPSASSGASRGCNDSSPAGARV